MLDEAATVAAALKSLTDKRAELLGVFDLGDGRVAAHLPASQATLTRRRLAAQNK